jgi:hypothetical protein
MYHNSCSSSWRIVKKFIDAVIQSLNNIYLPTTDEELATLATGWTIKSTADGCYHGPVLSLDGFLPARTQPRKDDCRNPADYFSVHKKVHAVNVQAAVDQLLRFRYVAVAGPGKTNDGRAFLRCNALTTWIDDLDEKYFICADNAYPLSNKALVPFRGAKAATIYNSSYNFYLSQLRIRVELAFGRFTTKFRRLRTKMSCRLSMQSKVIQAATRLHNYITDNDKPELGTIRLNADCTIDREELEPFRG